MPILIHFLSGALLCNCLPHLAAGLQGMRFQTPFARPRGVGESSALVNFLWGMTNLLAGLFLLRSWPVTIAIDADFGAAVAGALCLGTYLSLHFARVRQKTPPAQP